MDEVDIGGLWMKPILIACTKGLPGMALSNALFDVIIVVCV